MVVSAGAAKSTATASTVRLPASFWVSLARTLSTCGPNPPSWAAGCPAPRAPTNSTSAHTPNDGSLPCAGALTAARAGTAPAVPGAASATGGNPTPNAPTSRPASTTLVEARRLTATSITPSTPCASTHTT